MTIPRLPVALGMLAALQLVHLLDELRTDDDASFPGVVLTPQAVLGIGGAVVALRLVARRHRNANRIAGIVAILVAAGFALSHGLPVETARTEPYWGDGSADLLQWAGVLAILTTAAIVVSGAVQAARVGRDDFPARSRSKSP